MSNTIRIVLSEEQSEAIRESGIRFMEGKDETEQKKANKKQRFSNNPNSNQ